MLVTVQVVMDKEEIKKEIESLEKAVSNVCGSLNPVRDGKDHININLKGATKLGRALSNGYKSSFNHDDYGWFDSVYGFYYWLLSGKTQEQLRSLYGPRAKMEGEKYKVIELENDKFKEEVQHAIGLKIISNPWIANMLKESSLPFQSYYWYGDIDNAKIKFDNKNNYIISAIEDIRNYLKEEL